jgi:hypothetical protein
MRKLEGRSRDIGTSLYHTESSEDDVAGCARQTANGARGWDIVSDGTAKPMMTVERDGRREIERGGKKQGTGVAQCLASK